MDMYTRTQNRKVHNFIDYDCKNLGIKFPSKDEIIEKLNKLGLLLSTSVNVKAMFSYKRKF